MAPHTECRFRGNQNVVAPSGNGLAQDRFGKPFRVNVRRIEKIDLGSEANIHEPRRLGHVTRAPCAEKLVTATKGSRAKAQYGHFQSRASQRSKFHGTVDAAPARTMREKFSQKQKAARRRPSKTNVPYGITPAGVCGDGPVVVAAAASFNIGWWMVSSASSSRSDTPILSYTFRR